MSQRLPLAKAIMLIAVLLAAAVPAWCDEPPPGPGVYLLVAVNGEPLPAPTWALTAAGRRATIETIDGALLLDDRHQWAALITERLVWSVAGGARMTEPERTVLSHGISDVAGGRLLLLDADLTVHGTASRAGDDVLVTVQGDGGVEGQTSEYRLRKTPP